jgi:hypothetical protein
MTRSEYSLLDCTEWKARGFHKTKRAIIREGRITAADFLKYKNESWAW